MSTHVRMDDQHLVVHLSRRDRIFALRRDPRIPLTDIERVESVSDGRAAVTGVRAPGLGVPGRRPRRRRDDPHGAPEAYRDQRFPGGGARDRTRD